MATFSGSDGVILVGTDQVAEVRSYSIDETMDTLEDTSMGDTSRTYKTSLKSFSGSADVFFDDTDTSGQGALTVGTSATLNIQMEGNTTSDHKLTGSAIVTSRSIGVTSDGINTATYSLQGTGGLTETVV